MKYHITAVNSKPSTRKDGTPVLSRSGKTLFSVGIKTAEFGDVWLNGLMPFNPENWKDTEQEIEVYDEEYNGKTYKKFKLPPREPKETEGTGKIAFSITHLHQKIDHLQEDINNIRAHLIEGKRIPPEPSGRDYPTPEKEGINVDHAGMTDDEAEAELRSLGESF